MAAVEGNYSTCVSMFVVCVLTQSGCGLCKHIHAHITHIVTYTHTLLSCADVLNTTVVAIVCITLCVYSVYSCRGFWPTMPTVVYPFVVVWVN